MDSEPTLKKVELSVSHGEGLFETGQLLDGKYEVLSFLGKGGMGSVYRVKQVLLGVELALKSLDLQRLEDVSSSRRFRAEAKAAFMLKHPNLVKVHDFGVLESGHPYFAMDLVQGKTLQTFIKERGKLSLDEIEAIFVQLCFGLAHAHKHAVVHRDVKPANVMLADGVPLKSEGSVKILDFGIAKVVNEDRGTMDSLTMTGEVFGSPLYMSPEQCSGGAIDKRSDVYSLGCVLFEALTGTPPLMGSNPLRTMMLHVNEVAPTLKEAALGVEFPERLEQIVSRMLAKAPEDRYSDLSDVAHELFQVCSGKEYQLPVLSQTRESSTNKSKKDEHSHIQMRVVHFLLLLCSTAALSILGTFLFLQGKEGRKTPVPTHINKPKEFKVTAVLPLGKTDEPDPFELGEPQLQQAKEAFEETQTIGSKIVMTHGSKQVQIEFPKFPIGGVSLDIHSSKFNVDVRKAAVGKVEFPADADLMFVLNERKNVPSLYYPFIFKKIDRDIFTGLLVEGGETGELIEGGKTAASLGQKAKTVPALEQEVVAHHELLKAAEKWRKLNFLMLRSIHLTEELQNSIDNMTGLKALTLQKVQFDPATIGKRKFLLRLKELNVIGGDISELLKAISHSRVLQSVTIGSGCKVTSEAITILSGTTSLKTLDIKLSSVDDAMVTAVLSNKRITRVIFEKSSLSEAQKDRLVKGGFALVPDQKNPDPGTSEFAVFWRR